MSWWLQYQLPTSTTGGVSTTPLEMIPPDKQLQSDINSAFLHYAVWGALDPRNLADAKGIAKATGLGYGASLSVAAIVGAIGVGALITVIDPKHRYQGGWDDTKSGEAFFNRRKMDRDSIMQLQSQYITGQPALSYIQPSYTYDSYYS